MKVRFHPLFFLLAGVFVVLGKFELLAGYLMGIVAHEIAHNRMAKLRGYNMGIITIMPYGGVVDCGEDYNDSDNILIALSAPFFNLTLCTFIVAGWWVYPDIYNYTQDICMANLCLGLVNLLPLYPLDGSRVVISLAKNKLKCIKILRIITLIAGIGMLVLGLATIFVTLNITIPVFGLFLIFQAIVGSKKQTYFHIAKHINQEDNYRDGIIKKSVFISQTSQLFKLLRHIDKEHITEFVVVDERGMPLYTLTQSQVHTMCIENQLSDTIANAKSSVRKD